MTTEPKSSASTYSQGSWGDSPFTFSEARVDRRRFAIAISPSEDGPWKRPFPSAGASLSEGQVGKDVEHEGRDAEEKKGKKTRTKNTRLKKIPSILSAAPFSESRSTWMLGKMFPRRLAQPPQSASAALGPVVIIEMEQPRLPVLPPQVLLTLPSPELNIVDELKWLGDGNDSDDVALGSMPVSSNPAGPGSQCLTQPRSSLHTQTPKRPPTLVTRHRQSPAHPHQVDDPSNWKPKRPPSPFPPGMRRNIKVKHMRNTFSSSPPSPPPPVPPLVNHSTSVVPRSRATFSTPLSPPPPYQFHSLLKPMQSHVVNNEMTLQMILKARASKTATYALHNGGIFSPTSITD